MVIASSKSSTTSKANATRTTPIGTGKRKSKVPVSTSFSGLSKPRKPRGPRTPYNFFFADERAKMDESETEQDAAATMAAIKQGAGADSIPGVTDKPKPTFETTKARNKEIARKWRHFAQMQKIMGDNDLMKSYRAQAAEDEVRHKTEMAEYAQGVEDFNDAEAEAEQEFLELQTRVLAEARAKYGTEKEEKEESNDADNNEARNQPSSYGSPISNNIEGEAAATMTYLASGAGPGRPAPIPIPHPPPAPQYYPRPRSIPYMYCHPGAMYPMMPQPHLAHSPTLNALMAQRAGEAAAAHIPPSMSTPAANESVPTSMAYLQGYAAACNAMMGGGGGPAAAATPPLQQQPPASTPVPTATSSPTRSDLEKAVAAAGRKEFAHSTTAPLLEESQQKQADQDIFVARRRQGQKTTEE